MPKPKSIILRTAAFALIISAIYLVNGSGFLAAEGTTKAKSANSSDDRKVAGSIIITSQPKVAIKYAKTHGIATNFKEQTTDKQKIIAFDELPSDPKIQKLEEDLGTEAKPNYVYETLFTPDDSQYPAQWNMTKIKAPAAWDISRGSSNTVVAVIDSGVLFSQTINGTTYSQPDFPTSRQWENPGETGNTQAGDPCWNGAPEDKSTNGCDDDENALVDDWRGWDFMGGFRGSGAGCPNNGDASTYESPTDPSFLMQDSDPQPYSCDSPDYSSTLNKNHYDGSCEAWESACFVGHGTMVASVIAAETDNGTLVAGIDHNAKIMNVRVVDGYGYATSARIASGIEYAAENGADVINMSLGMSCDDESFTDPVMEDAIDAAKTAGVVSVAASGNDGWNTVCYPASSPDVMAVGATNQSDVRAGYSNYSNKLDVVAPAGVPVANAPSAYINSNYYSSAGGTSLATPHVAGLAALIKASDPALTSSQIIALIKSRADKVAGMNGQMYHKQYGYGRINLYVPLAVTDGTLPVYRLFRAKSISHFYTRSVSERDRAVNQLGYRYEGIGFWSLATSTGTSPVYRLFRAKSISHFYTKSIREKNRAINSLGYKYEGIGFRAPDTTIGTSPVYRLFRAKSISHFYTRSVAEKNRFINDLGYKYEGVGFRSE